MITDIHPSGVGGVISSSGALSLSRSALIGNSADGGMDSGSGAGALRVTGTAVVLNTTLAQNFSDGPGGAIRNYGRLLIAYSTLIDNTTRAGAKAVDTWSSDNPATLLKANIVGGTCHVTSGVVFSGGYNLVSSQTCAGSARDLTVVDFGLLPLTIQPGGTSGALPATSSPAIDVVPTYECVDWVEREVLTDQASLTRPRDGDVDASAACDAGALEVSDYTDDPLLAGGAAIKSVHITQLRAHIDALRVRHGLPAYSWTDPALIVGTAPIRAQHIVELRTALSEAFAAAGKTPPAYTDPTLLIGGMTIKAVHIVELRNASRTLESSP
jgi:hypothetical protein